jgi:hypothetical protein
LSTDEPYGGGRYEQEERVVTTSATYSSAKTNEITVEREDEVDWTLWEEVGSRGLDTWTGLPALYAVPDGSGSQPTGSAPRAGKGGRCARCCATTVVIAWKLKMTRPS